MREAYCQVDYVENWGTKYLNEPQAAYFDTLYMTIHLLVVHYRDEGGELSVLSYTGVSPDGSHAAPATYTYIAAMMEQLRESLPLLEWILFVSDSPTSQYRNRTIVAGQGALSGVLWRPRHLVLDGSRTRKGPLRWNRWCNQEQSRHSGQERQRDPQCTGVCDRAPAARK